VLSDVGESAAAVGVDFSRGQLRLAAENVPGASLVQGDMTALPFDDDAFDAVVAYWSLIHVPLADHQTVVDEFARVLRPGGRALLSEGTSEWVGENPDWLGSGVAMEWNVAGPAATRAQLRAAGFEIVETRDVPEPLDHDGDDGSGSETEGGDEDGDLPWRVFSARLDA
jgi:ubiquinone/menaquinone biosynthesis C-methylase UbiE